MKIFDYYTFTKKYDSKMLKESDDLDDEDDDELDVDDIEPKKHEEKVEELKPNTTVEKSEKTEAEKTGQQIARYIKNKNQYADANAFDTMIRLFKTTSFADFFVAMNHFCGYAIDPYITEGCANFYNAMRKFLTNSSSRMVYQCRTSKEEFKKFCMAVYSDVTDMSYEDIEKQIEEKPYNGKK